jgi:hypothetical protein
MDSNSEWQMRYAQQRVGDAHRMAAQHRAAKTAAAGAADRTGPLGMLLATFHRLFARQGRDESRPQPTTEASTVARPTAKIER